MLLKKPCKSINLLIGCATLCLITVFSYSKKLNQPMFTITLTPSLEIIFVGIYMF